MEIPNFKINKASWAYSKSRTRTLNVVVLGEAEILVARAQCGTVTLDFGTIGEILCRSEPDIEDLLSVKEKAEFRRSMLIVDCLPFIIKVNVFIVREVNL